MNTLTRIQLRSGIDETLEAILFEKAHALDHFAAKEEEQQVTATLYDRWDGAVNASMSEIRTLGQGIFSRYMPSPDMVMSVLDKHLQGPAITNGLSATLAAPIGSAFNKGRAATSAMFTKQTGRDPVRKDLVGFGAIFGLTEDHALQAMLDQVTIAAGGFWDNQLSDSIKAQLQTYFDGSETRDMLISNIQNLVNTKLLSSGQNALSNSYFDNLATHQVTRARNIGSYYRAKSLQATGYTIENPHDRRTCPICKPLTQGQVYPIAGAEQIVSGILTARSTEELKAAAPFLKPGDDPAHPFPPLHFAKCRCWPMFIFGNAE